MTVAQSRPTLCDPMDHTVHGVLQARILEWVAFPFSRGPSQPRSPTLQAASSPAEPPGKPKNTGVGSLSLLQWIFPTQESNRGLLHCRQILYQLSYQGSPSKTPHNVCLPLSPTTVLPLRSHLVPPLSSGHTGTLLLRGSRQAPISGTLLPLFLRLQYR